MSSAPSLPTSKKADQSGPDNVPADIMFATTDEEAVELHRFLCVISAPVLLAPIDAQDSMRGVLDVVHRGAAIVARLNGHIVGALGIVKAPWWYNRRAFFMTDRFCV